MCGGACLGPQTHPHPGVLGPLRGQGEHKRLTGPKVAQVLLLVLTHRPVYGAVRSQDLQTHGSYGSTNTQIIWINAHTDHTDLQTHGSSGSTNTRILRIYKYTDPQDLQTHRSSGSTSTRIIRIYKQTNHLNQQTHIIRIYKHTNHKDLQTHLVSHGIDEQ